jgi:hypothetical protein
MSKLTDTWRDLKVFNPTHFYNGTEPKGQVDIQRIAAFSVLPTAWVVYRRGYELSEDSNFPRSKAFSYHGREGGEAALAAAQEWAEIRYHIVLWAKDPYGSYGDASFVLARAAELKAAEAAL